MDLIIYEKGNEGGSKQAVQKKFKWDLFAILINNEFK